MNPHLPGVRGQVAGDHSQTGGFSGPVGTQEAQHLAPLQGETQIADGGMVAVAAGQVFDLQECCHGGSKDTMVAVWLPAVWRRRCQRGIFPNNPLENTPARVSRTHWRLYLMKLIGIDTGGTFTDFVLVDCSGANVAGAQASLSTRRRTPAQAIPRGACASWVSSPARSSCSLHGSTVATNAATGGASGARTVWITNRGFERPDRASAARRGTATLRPGDPLRSGSRWCPAGDRMPGDRPAA